LKNWKDDLLQASKDLYKEKLVAGTSGNLSMYDQEKGLMVITPSSIAYETMLLEDLVLMDLDGTIIEGNRRPSSEWKMHAKIYKERKDIGAVIHTHSPYATSFAVCNEEIPVILIEMVFFLGGDVKVAKFNMPGSEELGTEALKVLSDRKACLLSNHGTLSVGSNLSSAFESAIYLEDSAKIYHLAKISGNVHVIEPEFVKKMRGE